MRVVILLLASLIALLHSLGIVVMHDHAVNVGDGRAHIHSFLPDDHGHIGHVDAPVGHLGDGHAHAAGAEAHAHGTTAVPTGDRSAPVTDAAHADAGDSPRQRAMTALLGLLLVGIALGAVTRREPRRRQTVAVRRMPCSQWPRQRERLALLTVLLV